MAGVAINTGGNPTLRRNRIHDGKAGGVFVYENGQGVLEDNDVAGNALAGKPVGYTPRDHGDADPEVHQAKGERMERQ